MQYWWIVPAIMILIAIGNMVWVMNDRTKGFGDYTISGFYSIIIVIIALALSIGHFL